MSEANIPPTSGSSDLPIDASQPSSAPAADDLMTADVWQDWQTVDFPNVISVDAITAPSAADLQVADLITLIQQLNQCNTQLLDRVAQLESALEQSQGDLQAEIARHHEVSAVTATQEGTMQEQLTQLLHQLEFSHQANQRQQILVETLSEQLGNSQERIAQIERECSIAQQRCGEQAQKIVEVETTCRDLQIRLQRQQRYTLQFKVALDKCLDVRTPSYEAEPVQAIDMLAPQALLPKLVSIQPWSSQPQFPELDSEETPSPLSRLRAFESSAPTPASYDLKPTLSEWIDPAVPDDRALAGEAVPEPAALEPQVIERQVFTAETFAELARQEEGEAIEPAVAIDAASTSPPSAEEDLWQDLARLIDVSAEDVARAHSAENFSEFAQQLAAEPDWQPAPNPAIAKRSENRIASQPSILESPAPELPAPTAPEPEAPAVPSSWPSPIVYPLRSTRKRQSLAAVELPSFPR